MLVAQDPAQLFGDLVNIEMVAMLNEAFCELHHKPYCPPSEELTRECGKVRSKDHGSLHLELCCIRLLCWLLHVLCTLLDALPLVGTMFRICAANHEWIVHECCDWIPHNSISMHQ